MFAHFLFPAPSPTGAEEGEGVVWFLFVDTADVSADPLGFAPVFATWSLLAFSRRVSWSCRFQVAQKEAMRLTAASLCSCLTSARTWSQPTTR